MGIVVLSIYRCRLVLYSAGSGVNNVPVVLSGLSIGCYLLSIYIIVVDMAVHMLLLVCVDIMVISVYGESCSDTGGYAIPDVYMLKSVGKTPPP